MNIYAAGIVPYIKSNNKIQFLLGHEKYNKKWSGFVGKYESSDINIVNTAIREFNEETARVFEAHLEYVQQKIISGNCTLISDNSSSNKLIYIWFIEFPYEIINLNISNQFLLNLNLMTDNHYKEKTSLKWFNIQDIYQNGILYKLKKAILNNYKKL